MTFEDSETSLNLELKKKIKFNVKKNNEDNIEKNKIYNLDCLEYLKKPEKESIDKLYWILLLSMLLMKMG